MFKLKPKSITDFSLTANFFIGHDVNVEGLIKTEDDIYIDGNLNGEIEAEGLVEIAKNANVRADIRARALIIEGKFKGKSIVKEEVVIIRGAVTSGEIEANEVELEKGAIFNGQIKTASFK
ncbi:MAG: polymer-forming cytoskeletal protein [bacterium]|nr:polymer-forming cytoskeletal protein [bacterium]